MVQTWVFRKWAVEITANAWNTPKGVIASFLPSLNLVLLTLLKLLEMLSFLIVTYKVSKSRGGEWKWRKVLNWERICSHWPIISYDIFMWNHNNIEKIIPQGCLHFSDRILSFESKISGHLPLLKSNGQLS